MDLVLDKLCKNLVNMIQETFTKSIISLEYLKQREDIYIL